MTAGTTGEAVMGKVYEQLDDDPGEFIGRQHVFFVGDGPGCPRRGT